MFQFEVTTDAFHVIQNPVLNRTANTNAMMEKNSPPNEPTANEYQKEFSPVSNRKGINPTTVESTVRRIGIILWLYAFRNRRCLICPCRIAIGQADFR